MEENEKQSQEQGLQIHLLKNQLKKMAKAPVNQY
jgi:hypothetical protein